MDTHLPGQHCLIDMYGIDSHLLTNRILLDDLLCEAVTQTGLHAIHPPVIVPFPGGGLTGIVILAESHIAFHTYPELGYLAMDIFTCGSTNPRSAANVVQARLQPSHTEYKLIQRGELLGSQHQPAD